MYFHCVVPVAPVRSQPAHRSEMVTQLLFGEAVQLLETATGGWVRMKACFDGYEGWITHSHLSSIAALEPLACTYTTGFVNTILLNDIEMQLPYGSHIPQDNLALNTSRLIWNFTNVPNTATKPANGDAIVAIAKKHLNTPYLWGGKTVWGTDCSGLVQQVYKQVGIVLPRDAWQQAEQGEALYFLQEARPGDLAFFDNEEGRVTHTGILLNAQSILHASGKVRIDAIDTEGIVNSETGARTHHLRIVKRIL